MTRIVKVREEDQIIQVNNSYPATNSFFFVLLCHVRECKFLHFMYPEEKIINLDGTLYLNR